MRQRIHHFDERASAQQRRSFGADHQNSHRLFDVRHSIFDVKAITERNLFCRILADKGVRNRPVSDSEHVFQQKNSMKKHYSSESGIFIPRVLGALGLFAVAVLLAVVGFASDPAMSTITVPTTPNQKVTITWTGR